MNKRIFIGCLIAIAVLIGLSFTSVSGYNNVESNQKNSPLFDIRINSAIQKDSKPFTSNYLGKSKQNVIYFPQKDNKLNSFRKAIEGISEMNARTFTRFVDKVTEKLCESNQVLHEDIPKIKQLFDFLRSNPEDAKKYPFDLKKHSYTIGCPTPTFDDTPEFCFALFAIISLLILTFPIWFPIYIVLKFIDNFLPSIIPTCR